MLISKQRGISMPVVLMVVLVFVVAVRTGLALGPMYFDDKMLQQILATLKKQDEIDISTTNRDIRALLQQRLRFNSLEIPIESMEIERTREDVTIRWSYERRDNVMANIDLVARFQHEVVFDR